MKRSDIGFYFPGWTRKSLTFTIDDGNLKFDEIFLDILRPANIKGTFNLCDPNRTTPEEYREFYKGYEIANHCKLHPMCLNDNVKPIVSDEPFDKMGGEDFTEENPVVYKTENEGVYMRRDEHQRERCYTEETLRSLLTQSGFEIIDIVGDYDLSAPKSDCERWYFIARAKK